jgi:hypothetical protein
MLLKLVMPPYFRMIEGGTIIKWHKNEGDTVDFGDDLLDVRVEQVRITKTIKEATAGEWLQTLSKEMKKQQAGQAPQRAPENAPSPGEPAGAEGNFKTWDAVVTLRISSSDMGILRRIHARENEYRRVGELVAELTTAEDEPLESGTGPAHAGAFRVVANLA